MIFWLHTHINLQIHECLSRYENYSSFFTCAVVQTLYDDSGVHPLWLLWLAVALGILFLIMLIINIFLCSAMTCSCTRTDIIEKEPSIIEDYDPYRSWHGSQYGSRFDLITTLKRIAWLADKVSLLIASIIYDYASYNHASSTMRHDAHLSDSNRLLIS